MLTGTDSVTAYAGLACKLLTLDEHVLRMMKEEEGIMVYLWARQVKKGDLVG